MTDTVVATVALVLAMQQLRDANQAEDSVGEHGESDPYGASVSRTAAAFTTLAAMAYGFSAAIGYHGVHTCRGKR